MALPALLPPGAGSIDLRRRLLLICCLLIGSTYSLQESWVSVRIVNATGKTVRNELQVIAPVFCEVPLATPNKFSRFPEFSHQLLCPLRPLKWIQMLHRWKKYNRCWVVPKRAGPNWNWSARSKE